jgi:hypothetical protein
VKKFLPVFVAVAGVFAISSACAFEFNPPGERLAQERNATAAMNTAFDPDKSGADLIEAQMAGARGDWIMSAQLAEKSYREQPGIWNEFNLATADSHIGRNDLAEPLYVNLVERGQFTLLDPVQNFDGSWPAPMMGTVAQESNRRLDRMGYGGEGTVVSNRVGQYPSLDGPYPVLGEK